METDEEHNSSINEMNNVSVQKKQVDSSNAHKSDRVAIIDGHQVKYPNVVQVEAGGLKTVKLFIGWEVKLDFCLIPEKS